MIDKSKQIGIKKRHTLVKFCISCQTILYQKKAIVFNLVDNAIVLSDTIFHQQNLNFVKKIILSNAYPPKFIDKFINIRVNKLRYDNGTYYEENNDNNRERIIVLPYNESISKQLETGLKNVSKQYEKDLHKLHLEKLEFKLVYKIGNKLNTIIKKGRDKFDKGDEHNIVYKI